MLGSEYSLKDYIKANKIKTYYPPDLQDRLNLIDGLPKNYVDKWYENFLKEGCSFKKTFYTLSSLDIHDLFESIIPKTQLEDILVSNISKIIVVISPEVTPDIPDYTEMVFHEKLQIPQDDNNSADCHYSIYVPDELLQNTLIYGKILAEKESSSARQGTSSPRPRL